MVGVECFDFWFYVQLCYYVFYGVQYFWCVGYDIIGFGKVYCVVIQCVDFGQVFGDMCYVFGCVYYVGGGGV